MDRSLPSNRARWRTTAAAGILLAAALLVLTRTLQGTPPAAVLGAVGSLPARAVFLSLALVVASSLVFGLYDVLALRHLGVALPWGSTLFASAVAGAFSQSLGASVLTGGSVRFRLYSARGLTPGQIGRLVAFDLVTFWIGFFALAGAVLLLPGTGAGGPLSGAGGQVVGFCSLAMVASYLGLCLRGREVRILRWTLHPPALRVAMLQLVLSAVDWVLAAAALYVLFRGKAAPSFVPFLRAYLVAQLAGAASLVPGGLGVFESVALLTIGRDLPPAHAAARLLAYRGLYYWLPLAAAALALAAVELRSRAEELRTATGIVIAVVRAVAPQLVAAAIFLAGLALLATGALPSVAGRFEALRRVVPFPVMEASRVLASAVGAALLIVSRSVQRRIDAAFPLAVALLAGGIILSLLKGFEWEVATVLALTLGALLASGSRFSRRSAIIDDAFTPGWIAAISLALLGTLGIVLLVHRGGDLLGGGVLAAGGALRATDAAVVLALAYAFARLLHHPRAARPPCIREEIARASPLIDASRDTLAHLARVGDKALLFSPSGTTFLMYAVRRRSWIALGDPVGAEEDAPTLIQAFRELADEHGGWPVFYQLRPHALSRYVDAGLSLVKVGEEARVPLASFTLEGKRHKSVRLAAQRLLRAGHRLEVIPAEEVDRVLPRLKEVSDAWLEAKHTREKRFSNGCFDAEYLRQLPVAVVWEHGEIVAFANVLVGGDHDEISVDMMRYHPAAAPGTMDLLMVELFRWGKERGFAYFNFGIAPLAGLDGGARTPWTRFGSLVYSYFDRAYNFHGVRDYKAKFHPVWEPRYLAYPPGLKLPRILTDLVTLQSGGTVRGVLAK